MPIPFDQFDRLLQDVALELQLPDVAPDRLPRFVSQCIWTVCSYITLRWPVLPTYTRYVARI
jgi:hypothetical protein